jgi:hypothetical protein
MRKVLKEFPESAVFSGFNALLRWDGPLAA